jgi:nucleoside diphosphate kinase
MIFYYFYDKEAIIQAITDRGFEVRYEKVYTFRPDEVESLYIKHRNEDFFKALIEAYTA